MVVERLGRNLLAGCLAAAAAATSVTLAGQAPAPRSSNRLIHEKSPYLRLHAHNPVDWFTWGDEAIAKARRENKPIFLSVGYSTCHWCHVMEAESFADPAIAEVMNRFFVSIKVDREERPDIDRVYMAYVLASTGGGGWPMSVFLTPDLKPFFGDTYIPPDDRGGIAGFRTLIQRIAERWAKDRDKVLENANRATRIIETQANPGARGSGRPLDVRVLQKIYEDIKSSYDSSEGGFGAGPKFPRPVLLNFLLRHFARTGDRPALDMTLGTLRAMSRGGIHDHLGGGFHRYTTDRNWQVPHFEKMVYDQAQVAVSFIEAYQLTKDPALAGVARATLDYVHRDLRGAEGGFLSAEDADSLPAAGAARAAEGAFYVWTHAELRATLGDAVAEIFSHHYGVLPSGNVPAKLDLEGELKGRNVLVVRHTPAETAAKFKRSEGDVRALLDRAREKLADVRAARPRPPRDDKVIVAWNGLVLSAFARAAQVFDEPRYLDGARAAARFIETRMYDPTSNLLKRRYRDDDVDIDGMLEDYAFLIQGLLDLYEASFEVKWLSWAIALQGRQDQLFWDAAGGGYFSTREDAAHIIARMKDDYDGAEPSANSVAAMNLLRLWQVTDRKAWRVKAEAILAAQAVQLSRPGALLPQLAVALNFALSKPKQIVIAGDPAAADTRAMLRLVHDRFIPNKILLLLDGGAAQQQIAEWLPFVANIDRRDGKATAYICENYVCNLPTTDPQTAARLLDGKGALDGKER
ncbi:MAG: DUF255 domain-containing protein [Luteitalea sp.]|nr:DUF255 domain-containing protein [Luteitalea sp.]